jgi:multiple antibiotic resistance protein
MLELATTAFITLFVIIEPVAIAPIFAALTHDMTALDRRNTAIKAVLVAGFTLLVFALAGELLLKTLGISFGAFRIAGGILLFMLSVEMVFAHQSGIRTTTAAEEKEAHLRKELSVFPIGIPLLAGPGAMASIVLLMGQTQGSLIGQSTVIGVLLLVLALTLVMLILATKLTDLFGVTGVNVLGRIFGIILAALAIQYVIDGIRESFPSVL